MNETERAGLKEKVKRLAEEIPTLAKEKREAEVALAEPKPGNGWIILTKVQLLKALGLNGEFDVLGVRWSGQSQEIKVDLRSFEIGWRGGRIVQTDPIRTEKEIREDA